MIDIKAARALCEQATPGPWTAGPWAWWSTSDNAYVVCSDDGDGRHVASIDHDIGADHDCPQFENNEADAAFIAASRALVPALLDRIEQLEEMMHEALALASHNGDACEAIADIRAELEQGK